MFCTHYILPSSLVNDDHVSKIDNTVCEYAKLTNVCQNGLQTLDHILQSCSLFGDLGAQTRLTMEEWRDDNGRKAVGNLR